MPHIKNQYQFRKYMTGWVISFIAWYFLNSFYIAIRFDALVHYSEFLGLKDYFQVENEMSNAMYANALLSLVLSLFTWNFYFLLDKRSRIVAWKRIILIFFIVSLVTSLLFVIVRLLSEDIYESQYMYFNVISGQSFLIYSLYILICGVLINSLFQLRDILGPELFKTIVRGYYYVPHEDKRIFMFLDLYNSTTIAEKLGHMRYSKLIQECYRTMTDSISEYKASVYQYVGDEVVLTWPFEKGVHDNRCIMIFYAIQNAIQNRSDYFMKNFGVVPEFKAGVHAGIVSVVQVGVIKRELAYHGDVVNATSRIQEQCKKLKANMLISEYMATQVSLPIRLLGECKLRGKTEIINVYTVEKDGIVL